nr:hypothetical protein [uncultured Schaedlerella sp.]
MKSKLTKATAVALAMTMCMPVSAMAAGQQGTFETSFDLYSPKLTVSVPLKADIRINPLADSSKTDVNKFEVASNSIDVINASVDVANDKAIPVNVTVKANISNKADNVISTYNTYTPNPTSPVKKINLNLSQAGTAAVLGAAKKEDGTAETAAFISAEDKTLDLSKFAVATAAVYTTPAQSTPITQWGSSISVDIAGPTTSDTTNTGATYSTTATAVTPKVGSFAVTGVANVSADWKADDIAVDMTYDVRASAARGITTPTLAAQTYASSATTDLSFDIAGVGEATVTAIAVHNDESSFKDFIWEEDGYTVEPKSGAAGTVTVKIKKAGGLTYMGENDKGKTCDLAIALSDGRMVVSTLTVN